MSKINFKKEKIPFTQVANEVLNDKNLSAKAKGLYAYLYSKPDGWDFALDRIAKDFKDGRRAVYTGILELEERGLLKRKKIMGNSENRGRTKYHLLSKIDSKPVVDFSNDAKQQRCKIDSISNKESKVIKSNSNKDSEHSSRDIVELINSFSLVNPAYKKWYANKTQRAAAERLLETHGKDKLEKAVQLLPQTNTMQYFPTITTIVQLEDKWASLAAAFQKKKHELQAKKPIVI